MVIQAKQANADFIIFNKNIEKIYPEFDNLINRNDLELFPREFESNNKKIIVYKLNKNTK